MLDLICHVLSDHFLCGIAVIGGINLALTRRPVLQSVENVINNRLSILAGWANVKLLGVRPFFHKGNR